MTFRAAAVVTSSRPARALWQMWPAGRPNSLPFLTPVFAIPLLFVEKFIITLNTKMSADWRILGRRHQFRTKSDRLSLLQSRSVDSLIDLQDDDDRHQPLKAFATCRSLAPGNTILTNRLRPDEFSALDVGTISPIVSSISYQDAWKTLGKRRQYRLSQAQRMPQVSITIFSRVPQSKSTVESRLDEEDKCQSHRTRIFTSPNECKIKYALPTPTPHIATLYLLEEMERYQQANLQAR